MIMATILNPLLEIVRFTENNHDASQQTYHHSKSVYQEWTK